MFTLPEACKTVRHETHDLQVYHIECMRNQEPHCCEEPCGWQQENITEDGDCEVFGDYMTCLFDKETRNLTTPSKLRKTAARCKIHKKKQNFHMSCYHNGKPICCDTPCECDLNLLNATCTMQVKSMECSCAGSGSADNPVLNFCFKNTCLHKTDHKVCDFQADDTCYISTGVTDGKGQKQKSKQVIANSNKGQFFVWWIFIGGIVLGILISWIYCYFTRKYSKCGSCCGNRKKLDHKRKERFLEDKETESKTTADEDQEEIKEEERNPCLQQHEQLEMEKNVRHRISSTSSSESEPGNRTGTLY